MGEPVPLRAHHLISAKYIETRSKEFITRGLLLSGHIKDPSDPFIENAYDKLKEIFSNPEQRIEIRRGGMDFLCDSCPRFRERRCTPLEPKRVIFLPIGLARYEGEIEDKKVMKKYGFKEEIYTVAQIRNKLGF